MYNKQLNTELCRIEYLKYLCKRGWKKYLSPLKMSAAESEVYRSRLNYELDILILKQFVSYFLMVQDYVNYAKDNRIYVGPGRGSGAGSLVAYLLNITEIDPVRNKLMFERFLNPALSTYDFQIDPSIEMNTAECQPIKLSKFPRWTQLSLPQQEAALLEYRYILRQHNLKYLIDLKRNYHRVDLPNDVNSFVAWIFQLTNECPADNRITRLKVLEPGSIAVPDFDVDFADERRHEVINYIFRKYGGVEYASTIGTRQTLKSRNVMRDVCRVYEMPIAETTEIVKLIESTDKMSSSAELSLTLQEAIDKSVELRMLHLKYPHIFDTALKLEGLPRNTAKHAAGLIVSPEPITNYIPLRKLADEEIPTSQLDMNEIALLGLLKVDILGLRTLSVIGDCLDYIKERTGEQIELRELGEDYPEVWKLFNSDCFGGIFQIDGSSEMNRLCTELKPNCKNDLSALVALHRPGPLSIGLHNKYIHRKHGYEAVEYVHPEVKGILKDTYGTMIYQEQLIQIAQALAGYNAVQADELRKAISKSKPELIEKQKTIFLAGCRAHGVADRIALGLYEDFVKFGQYAFNRAHSASYGEIAFRTAWLKVYYPREFYCALLNHTIDAKNLPAGALISKYSKEMRKFFNLKLLPPDINSSSGKFTIEEGGIRFGLSQIKGVGEKCLPIIEQARVQLGSFTSFEDFARKIKQYDEKALRHVNKRPQEAMIRAGCFDSIKYTEEQPFLSRSLLLEYRDDIIKDKKIVFPSEYQEESVLACQKLEKEVMDIAVTGEILSPYKRIIQYYGMSTLRQAKMSNSMGKTLNIACEVINFDIKQDRNGNMMCFMTVEDREMIDSVVIFHKIFDRVKPYCTKKGLAIMITGKVDMKQRLLIQDVRPIESLVIT